MHRSLLMFTMENCFYLLISQAVRYLRDPAVHPRDKQRMKQELSSELVSSVQSCFPAFEALCCSPPSPFSSCRLVCCGVQRPSLLSYSLDSLMEPAVHRVPLALVLAMKVFSPLYPGSQGQPSVLLCLRLSDAMEDAHTHPAA